MELLGAFHWVISQLSKQDFLLAHADIMDDERNNATTLETIPATGYKHQ